MRGYLFSPLSRGLPVVVFGLIFLLFSSGDVDDSRSQPRAQPRYSFLAFCANTRNTAENPKTIYCKVNKNQAFATLFRFIRRNRFSTYIPWQTRGQPVCYKPSQATNIKHEHGWRKYPAPYLLLAPWRLSCAAVRGGRFHFRCAERHVLLRQRFQARLCLRQKPTNSLGASSYARQGFARKALRGCGN